jgi:hypothetical protein
MHVCDVFKQNGTIPVGIGLVELWQEQLWYVAIPSCHANHMVFGDRFQLLSLRLGGRTWWNQLLAGQIDFSTGITAVITEHFQSFYGCR